jgi:hypothetical protein
MYVHAFLWWNGEQGQVLHPSYLLGFFIHEQIAPTNSALVTSLA